ncbi:tryptophan 2,3-dioxygenase family protein [Acrocarpospora catenulata]|uniref:tryptophan 2,3-dioxygenase family protein n=1 Tax=Acrocarpospora catenulata TaxID=2836182 RepID=UPI001BD9EB2A|nr:tryptophan 2,3-dioxygenase family protein [Acrocarpospora catenulata]
MLKTFVGEGKLDYERYLSTSELFTLQSPTEELICSEELMFQIVHQVQELWLKLLTHELTELVGELDDDALWEASARLERIVRIGHCLSGEIRVLETLTPETYQTIRRHLGKGSGQESPGYNRVRVAAEYVSGTLDRLVDRRGTTVYDVYAVPGPGTADLRRVLECLVDVDEAYQTWLFTHFMLVRRTIGVSRGTAALDGVSTQVLTGRMTQPLFRQLWKVREQMTATWNGSGGYAPGAARTGRPET